MSFDLPDMLAESEAHRKGMAALDELAKKVHARTQPRLSAIIDMSKILYGVVYTDTQRKFIAGLLGYTPSDRAIDWILLNNTRL